MVARAAQPAGIAGLAFFSGIPGSIGGALRMNGGAYGGETKDVLIEARGVDRQGNDPRVQQSRTWDFHIAIAASPDDVIFTSARVSGQRRRRRSDRRRDGRHQEQARDDPAAQSHRRLHVQESAGHERLEAGRRGRLPRTSGRPGKVSDLHSNFLINLDGATAADIETLGETVRERVKAHSGVELEWEIKRIGVAASPG